MEIDFSKIEVFEVLKFIIPSILAFLFGKKIGNQQADRKEDWDLLNNLKAFLSLTSTTAIDFYSTNEKDIGKAIQLQRNAKKIASDFFNFLKATGCANETKLVVEYRKALTMNLDKIDSLTDTQRDDIKDLIIESEIKLSEFAWTKFRSKHRKN